MEADRTRRALSVVEEALELPDDERRAWVKKACGADAALRESVERLLSRETTIGGFLEPPEDADLSGALAPEADLPAGAQLGGFRIVRALAAGGMGTVYEAEQDHPRRRVALKVLRRGLASRSALRRFQDEAECLGRLRHPSVAQIYEAGVHHVVVGGQAREIPYFAMELVEGARDVVAFSEEKSLDLRARLELMVRVCEAVHHGHEKGVIHRDLKPGNILVDPSGRTKVIDFGVARALDRDARGSTGQTKAGRIVGTLQFMSPEQLEGSADVDIRSDVYSLGAVLFELACGRLPYDVEGKPIHEAARVIRETDPRRPSAVAPDCPRAIEWILLKALEKDRARRYASASELAADLSRFLGDEPVVAGPPSAVYRLRLFARRHRTGVAAATIAAAALLVGTTGLAIGLVRETRALQTAEKDRGDAVSARAAAQRDADRQRMLYLALRGVLAPADVDADAGPGSLPELLIDAADGIEAAYPGEPEVALELRRTLGASLLRFGFADEAEPLILRALQDRKRMTGVDDSEVLETLVQLGDLYSKRGRFADAASVYEEALAGLRRTGAGESTLSRHVLRSLAPAQEALGDWARSRDTFRELVASVERARKKSEDGMVMSARHRLSGALLRQGQFAEAEALLLVLEDVARRRLPANGPMVLGVQNQLGSLLLIQGRIDEAEPHLRRAIDGARALGRSAPPDTPNWALGIAELMLARGDLAGAEKYARALVEAPASKSATPPRATPANGYTVLARTLAAQGRFEEALPFVERAIETHRRQNGEKHPYTFADLRELGVVLAGLGRKPEAVAAWTEAHDIAHAALGDNHPWTQDLAAAIR